ncbi:MAG: glycerol-3-phosphate dehydrogenase [Porticoccus sp.]|jgi:glycerol-3-phosphate dehydrogenase
MSNESESTYDVVVIGGGIQGAGVAQAAQAAGYSTLILEKTDWAAGTSSKSSKLIHGGLRYLQSGELSLVQEGLQERALLLKNAPELVHSNWFYLPIYTHSQHHSWQIYSGLTLYWMLSGCQDGAKFEVVPKTQWNELAGLETKNLQKVYRYHDAQTDDAKLTAAVVQSAVSLGAKISCPANFINAEKTEDGYRVCYEHSQETEGNHSTAHQSISCRFLVNAGGPWINQIVNAISPPPRSIDIDLVQGTHLILDQKISDQCFYLESPADGRAVFVLPWYDKTLLGTTETLFEGNPEYAAPTEQERQYLLDVLASYFPDYTGKVCGEMAGLRVLPSGRQKHYQRSREVRLITDQPSQPHYVGVYGGKLTGYRATAEKVVKVIESTLGSSENWIDTKTLPLILPTS